MLIKIRVRIAKSVKHSSKSGFGWPKESAKHSSKSRVGDQKLTTVSHFGAKGLWWALMCLGAPWAALGGLISDLVSPTKNTPQINALQIVGAPGGSRRLQNGQKCETFVKIRGRMAKSVNN